MSLNWDIQVLGRVDSTQTHLQELDQQEKVGEGTVVQALTQTGGKGRRGNDWVSPMGNLYMSFLLRPDCNVEKAGELGFVIANGISGALTPYLDAKKHDKRLKWPNDVYIDGLKIAGILLDADVAAGNTLKSVCVGVGVNIFTAPDLAVSLNQVANQPVYVNKVRDQILAEIGKMYTLWQDKGFAPIREIWLNQAYGLNKPITARLSGATYQGVFSGVGEDGALLIKMDDGQEKHIHAAEVHF